MKRAWGSYVELAKDSEVDIVYVSNVHPAHKDTTLLMLDHGKHVLCEKPLAVRVLALHHQGHPQQQDDCEELCMDPLVFAHFKNDGQPVCTSTVLAFQSAGFIMALLLA